MRTSGCAVRPSKFNAFYSIILALFFLCLTGLLAVPIASADVKDDYNAKIAAGLSPEEAAQEVAAERIAANEDPGEVGRMIAAAAVESAIAQGVDVAEATRLASSGTAKGAIEGAVASGQSQEAIASVVQAASTGNASGAVEAAVANGQDVVAITTAATSGTAQGTVEGASTTGQNMSSLTQAAAQGSAQGANNAAVSTSQDVNAVNNAAQSGTQQGAETGATNTGQNVNAVTGAANAGTQNITTLSLIHI